MRDYKNADKLDQNEAIRQGLIRINNNYYRVLKSTQVTDNGNGLYLNNLVIGKTQITDSGNYICLAANSNGFSFKATHLTVLPVISSTDGTSDSLSSQTSITTIFWLIVASVSIVFILLSRLLCLRQTQPNQVSINNIESRDKEINRKVKHKDYISNNKIINDWLNEQDSCLNPAYNCVGIMNSINEKRQPFKA